MANAHKPRKKTVNFGVAWACLFGDVQAVQVEITFQAVLADALP